MQTPDPGPGLHIGGGHPAPVSPQGIVISGDMCHDIITPSGWEICDEMQICDQDSLEDSLQDRHPGWADRDGGPGLRHHSDQGHGGRGSGHLPRAAGQWST